MKDLMLYLYEFCCSALPALIALVVLRVYWNQHQGSVNVKVSIPGALVLMMYIATVLHFT